MAKEIRKDFFVQKLYNGYVITEDGKKSAVETPESLKEIILRKLNFINVAIDTPTTENFGITIQFEENCRINTKEELKKIFS